MRYTGPVRFIFKGDRATAQLYINVARSLIGSLVSSTTVTAVSRKVVLADKTKIFIQGYSDRELSERIRRARIDASSARFDLRRSWITSTRGLTQRQQGERDLLESRIATMMNSVAATFQVIIDVTETDEEAANLLSGYLIRLPFADPVEGEQAPHVILDHKGLEDDEATFPLWVPYVYSEEYRPLVSATTWDLQTYGPPRLPEPIQVGNVDWRGPNARRLSWDGDPSRLLGLGTGSKIYRLGKVTAEVPDEYGPVQGACINAEGQFYAATLEGRVYYLLRRDTVATTGWRVLSTLDLDELEVFNIQPYHPVVFNESGTEGKTLIALDANSGTVPAVWGVVTFSLSGLVGGITVAFEQVEKHELSNEWLINDPGSTTSGGLSGTAPSANDSVESGSSTYTSSKSRTKTVRSQNNNAEPPYPNIPTTLVRPIAIDYKGDTEVRLEFEFLDDQSSVISYSYSRSYNQNASFVWTELSDDIDLHQYEYTNSFTETESVNASEIFDFRAGTVRLPGVDDELVIGARGFTLQMYYRLDLSVSRSVTAQVENGFYEDINVGAAPASTESGDFSSSGQSVTNVSRTGSIENSIAPRLTKLLYVDLRDSVYIYTAMKAEGPSPYSEHSLTITIPLSASHSYSGSSPNTFVTCPTPTYSGTSYVRGPTGITSMQHQHKIDSADVNSLLTKTLTNLGFEDTHLLADQIYYADPATFRWSSSTNRGNIHYSPGDGTVSYDDIFFPGPDDPRSGTPPSLDRNDTVFTRLSGFRPTSTPMKNQYANHPSMRPLLYYWAPEPTTFGDRDSYNLNITWGEGMNFGPYDVISYLNFAADLKDHENFIGLFTDGEE